MKLKKSALFSLNKPLCKDSEKGVTLVEFALIVPIFMFFTLGMVDLARVYTLKAILNKGAEEGLNVAKKLPNLDADIATLDPMHIDYLRYQQSRRIVIDRATRLPLSTFFTDSNTEGMAKLVPYVYRDPDIAPNPDRVETADAGFLRPGDRLGIGSTVSGDFVTHKTFPNDGTGAPPIQEPKLLLREHPVTVELRATIRPLTPFVPELNISSRSSGYREEIPKGALDVAYGLTDPIDLPGVIVGPGEIPEPPVEFPYGANGPIVDSALATYQDCLGRSRALGIPIQCPLFINPTLGNTCQPCTSAGQEAFLF